jgi:DNA-directed RNA polymerase specialized sigma24 family protein
MLSDHEPPFCARPFWFASSELLAIVLRAESNIVNQILAKYPNLPSLLDAPESTVRERTACFTLLAHAKLIEIVGETFAERYEPSPSLDEVESSILRRTYNLVAPDAPVWVQEMVQVVEQLRVHICTSLPGPLREQRFDNDNPEKIRAIDSARKTFENVEQIQTLTGRVLDQQSRRLERRWVAGLPDFQTKHLLQSTAGRPKGTGGLVRKRDLSQYMDRLTEKQHLAFSLRFEYELRLSEIASRMGINRKTADEHIKAAQKKVEQARSSDKRKARRAGYTPES